jgi:hypothetical protein
LCSTTILDISAANGKPAMFEGINVRMYLLSICIVYTHARIVQNDRSWFGSDIKGWIKKQVDHKQHEEKVGRIIITA